MGRHDAALSSLQNGPQSLFRLDGRIAFVSAAPGHLGRAMTRALCGAGAHVIVNARDDARLAAFEASLRDEGHSVERAAFDVADVEEVRRHFSALPRLDILVNNAIAMTPKPFASLEPSDFAQTYA
ncbi:MAG TPA: SDR family NAD(P)-dependent oxidoreductase, partial [Rhizomicrobium sp.]